MTPLPRVTAILHAVGLAPDFSRVDPAVLEAARARGVAVHAAIEAHQYGYLDQPIDLETAGYFYAYLKFLSDSGHEPIVSELEVIHPMWGYVGHPDRVGWLSGRRVLLDWKTGEAVDLDAAGRQLAGYRLAYHAMHPETPIDAVAVVQLREDGTYRYHEITRLPHHEQVFLAALVVYQAQQRKGVPC